MEVDVEEDDEENEVQYSLMLCFPKDSYCFSSALFSHLLIMQLVVH